MSLKNLIFILIMMVSCISSLLIYNFYSYDLVFSISLILNLFLSFIILWKKSPDEYLVKLSIVYLVGFTLFIGGRYIANIFGVEDIYCYEFGYSYCLSGDEKIKLNFLINFSLISFIIGFLYKSNKVSSLKRNNNQYFNKKVLSAIVVLSFVTGTFSIYFQLEAVAIAINKGYSALYEGQDEAYQAPFSLISNTLFVASLATIYSVNKNIKPFIFYSVFSIFIAGQLLGVLTGARSSFINAIIILLWLFLGTKKISPKKILVLASIPFVFLMTNYLSSLSGARSTTSGGSFYDTIILEIFYGQGTSMMVFGIGSLETDYPVLAYLKTIFPGIQIIYSFFTDINNYELSFSQSLSYRLAPSVYYDNMGWGWSLLGDFYAFSFGFSILFLLYNFIWGKLIFKISLLNDSSMYYRGLFFCFLITVFSINRASISYLVFLVFLYTFFYFSLKLILGRKYKHQRT